MLKYQNSWKSVHY